jgi:hypothetical protein
MSERPSTWVVLPGAVVDVWEPVAIITGPTGCRLVLRSGTLVHVATSPADAWTQLEKRRADIRAWEARPAREREPRPRPRKGRKRKVTQP